MRRSRSGASLAADNVRAADVVRDAQVRAAWADFTRGLAPWAWFVTLTFQRELPPEAASKVVQTWLRSVAMEINAHVRFAIASELKPHQAIHFHLLLAPFDGVRLTRSIVRRLWKRAHPSAGFMHFGQYDADRGAVHYVINHEHRDLNVACPRPPKCRRTRCVEAPGSW